MNWVKNHTCENCKWSAKGWIDKGIFVKSNDYYAKHCCIYHQRKIPGAIDCCTCDCWAEDKEVSVEEKYTKDGLVYCSCGGEPKIEQSDYYRSGYDGWYVYCRKCGKQVVCENQSGAISLWNNKHAKE